MGRKLIFSLSFNSQHKRNLHNRKIVYLLQTITYLRRKNMQIIKVHNKFIAKYEF